MAAMGHVHTVYPGVRMHLYGPGFGPDEQAQKWAAEHNLEDVFVFHGWTVHGQAMRELAEMDLLIHPAIEESFGMTVAEAMALGVPVVAGECSGAVPWVLGTQEGGGALVDVRSPEQIAHAILTILSDPGLYARYSQQGRARACAHFSASAVARSYLDLYRDVLRDSGVVPVDLPRVPA